MDEAAHLRPILEQMVALPTLDLVYSEDTEVRLPEIAGGLGLALARTFGIIDPKLENPQTKHWDRAFGLFDLLL
jgi:hypothetical protein